MPYDNIDPSLLQMNQQPNFSWQSRMSNGLSGLMGNRDLALALLQNSGPSTQKRSFGQILAGSMAQADQMKQGREDDAFKRQYMQAQMQAMQGRGQGSPFGAISPDKFTTESLAKFQNSKNYGDLVARDEIGKDPSEVSAYKYWAGLTKEQQQDFLKLKRNVGADYAIETVNGVPTVVYKPAAGGPGVGGGTPLVTPLTTLSNQAAGAAAIKGAEAQAGAVGAGTGGIIAGIQKKGADAKTVMSTLDIADSLIDASTGSLVGAGADKLAAVFGKAPQGAQATAQLQVLQAGLMLNMPRMEGPQSDRDVELYRQAAASLGDPTVPREIKKAAVKTIRQMQQNYADRAKQPFQLSPQQQSGGWSIQPAD